MEKVKFTDGLWNSEINVADFVYNNIAPYEGEASFLQGPSARTMKLWNECLEALAQERRTDIVHPYDYIQRDVRKENWRNS